MTVLTISRETGSYGRIIAGKTAEQLCFTLVDKTKIGHIFSRYSLNEFGIDTGYIPDLWTHFDSQIGEQRQQMVEMLNQIILAIAHHGKVVIVGRSSFSILQPFSDVLHVRIQAPLHIRVQRVMQRSGISNANQAEIIVRESDRVRGEFIQYFYHHKWDAASPFDIVLNTGKIAPQMGVRWLVDAVDRLQKEHVASDHTTDSILVNPMLSAIVEDELRAVVTH